MVHGQHQKRGMVVSFWHVGHNIGGAMAHAFVALWGVLCSATGAKIILNAAIARPWRDRVLCRYAPGVRAPPRRGIPARNPPATAQARAGRQLREIWSKSLEQTVSLGDRRPNEFVFVRYGVGNGIPTYLQTARDFVSAVERGWDIYEWAAIPGTIACGWWRIAGSGPPARHILFSVDARRRGLRLNGTVRSDRNAALLRSASDLRPIMFIGLQRSNLVP